MGKNYSPAFGDFPDIAPPNMPEGQGRFGLTGDEAVEWYQQEEHPGWRAEAAYAVLESVYGSAYEANGDREQAFEDAAITVQEEVGKPLMQYNFLDTVDELPAVDLPYEDVLRSANHETKTHSGLQKLTKVFPSPETPPHGFRDPHEFREFVYGGADDDPVGLVHAIAPDEPDVVVTPWASGIPVMDLADGYLDVDDEAQVVYRFSPSLKDTGVQITPKMEQRAEEYISDAHVLVLDDVIASGSTMEQSYNWLQQYEPEQVTGIVVSALDHMDEFDTERWPQTSGAPIDLDAVLGSDR